MKNYLIMLIFLIEVAQIAYGDIMYPISDVFNGKDISDTGCQKLDDVINKFNNNTILIEVFCNNKLDYDYTWELANIYAYKITKCLIDKGYNQNKIRYIGYGNLNIEEPDRKNVIKISIQEIESLTQNSPVE